jgi:hypothetical protein
MMHKIKTRIRDKRELAQVANHLFFITAFLFVAHQNSLHPAQMRVEAPMIAQALNFQPRTPPPGFDPDQVMNEEIDWSIRPE